MIEEESVLDNIEVHKKFAIISINPKLYPLSVIYSAAYWLLDKAHVIIDGDPDTEILVEIRPKEKDTDLKELGYKFNDELINYSVYTVQATRNKRIREMIVENALSGNIRSPPPSNNQRLPPRQKLSEEECVPCSTGQLQTSTANDPENIANLRSPRDSREDFKRDFNTL